MNEDVKSENAHIHSRADELIACLEGEIAERDARIVELESDLAGTQSRVLSLQDQWRKLDAELAAIKAQGVVLTDEELCSIRNQVACNEVRRDDDSRTICVKHGRALEAAVLARLNTAPVQQVSVPDGWRELAKRADDFLYSLPETDGVLRLRADLCSMLAAPAAPAADAYSWRRKEGVNGIKEFMAQKCYDAQTDAIKKYYEPFKCANCKAADAGLVEALEHARLFIVNGIALGFIQMPEADTPDPAHETLPMIDAALSAGKDSGQ